ncbi:aspartate beta-hydroxylase domain-containing protein 2-like [Girardinichthys multiradiatus]|uniref:aspartate beta-hydroxylase domain-containing protein 2-like n=1 Tax=Girardinichthys multiradiatus TaxID=208333 RepID=UPI001FAC55B9|nr:aspartate beta-hydroxylase domain-containing protein 2-like [Girardinichthys multiradiatus]
MHWSMNTLPLPEYVELGVRSLSGLLWTLLFLFLWHCYRIGTDLPIPGHAVNSKSSSRRSMISRSGVCIGTNCSARSKLSRSEQLAPFISMETAKNEEQGQGYLTPVLSHTLFPAQASAEAKKLYAALQEYAKRYSWVGMGRIHKGLREQVRLNDLSTIQKPHLFFLPDVPSVPFFPRDAHRHDIEVLEANYPAILAEFQAVYQRGIDSKLGWTSLSPKSQAVFPLYSAGVCVAKNCRSCPSTYRTLLSLRTFINSNSLGSAGFWLLGPGAILGSSYGPTNTRLRCHLGLKTPPLCELVVGGEPQCWSEGHCLLLDDSFLHIISHKGPSESGPRVILNVDLWHPNVAAAERQALDFMFTPDL